MRYFPARLAEATGWRALAYDRYGYGQSDVLAEPRVGTDFMHREALETLPALLAALAIERPVLVGHSDGASIALIYAGSGRPLAGLVAMAPHVFVEDVSIASIEAARRQFESHRSARAAGKIPSRPGENLPALERRLARS
ncbi:MAG: alpha/beta fold hydrolase [Burkholderiales bacterium]|nr:alpha/beta fold hydrolase [Burkholderiales bacterium]